MSLGSREQGVIPLERAPQSVIEPNLIGSPVVNPGEGIAVEIRFQHTRQREWNVPVLGGEEAGKEESWERGGRQSLKPER